MSLFRWTFAASKSPRDWIMKPFIYSLEGCDSSVQPCHRRVNSIQKCLYGHLDKHEQSV